MLTSGISPPRKKAKLTGQSPPYAFNSQSSDSPSQPSQLSQYSASARTANLVHKPNILDLEHYRKQRTKYESDAEYKHQYDNVQKDYIDGLSDIITNYPDYFGNKDKQNQNCAENLEDFLISFNFRLYYKV